MNDADRKQQRALHEAIEHAVFDPEVGDAHPGTVLAGWIVIYETAALDDEVLATAGHFYGPSEMSTWRALGLIEWARRFGLTPDPDDYEEDHD